MSKLDEALLSVGISRDVLDSVLEQHNAMVLELPVVRDQSSEREIGFSTPKSEGWVNWNTETDMVHIYAAPLSENATTTTIPTDLLRLLGKSLLAVEKVRRNATEFSNSQE